MDRYKLVNLTGTKKDPRRKRRCKLTQSPLRLGRKLVAPGTSVKITEDQYRQHKKIIDAYLLNKVFEFVPINETQKEAWGKLIALPIVEPVVEIPIVEIPTVEVPVVKININEPVIEITEELEVKAFSKEVTPKSIPKKSVAKKEEPKAAKKTYAKARTTKGSGKKSTSGKKS